MKILFFLGLFAFGLHVSDFTQTAQADEFYTFVVKKQEEKKKTQWSLAEWLDTRDRMRLMDLWLALHSPTPYEFYIDAQYQLTESATDMKKNNFRVSAAAYASIFGLELSRGTSPFADFSALALLRIFGYHAQGTNITFQGGVRSQTEPVSARNAVMGVTSSIYIARHFGVDGGFKHNFQSVPNPADVRTSGNRWDIGAFIDFDFLRIYGKYFSETETKSRADEASRNGVLLGTRLFF